MAENFWRQIGMFLNYIKKQARRMHENKENNLRLYKDACFRLLSHTDAIPPTYFHEDCLTTSDIEKAEQIATKALKDG